jgi:hypothetical protein
VSSASERDFATGAALSAQLRAKLSRRLAREWDELNWQLFASRLRRPVLELLDNTSLLGRWSAQDRTLGLSLPAILSVAWLDTIETLKHEMAHQFVDEVLGGEARPHGPTFRQVCEARGINPSATGRLEPRLASDALEDRVITRVRKLLALAESSNQHEAETAATAAQRLMLKFNIDLQDNPEVDRSYEHLWLGKPSGRVPAHERALGALLTEHFFVEGIWLQVFRPLDGKTGTVLELCGRPENLKMAAFVHGFLLGTIERLWKEHKRARGVRSNRDRRAFLSGAVAGFEAKLSQREQHARAEGLVWVRDTQAQAYLGRRYPRTVRTRYSSRQGAEAYSEGHDAGGGIVLSKPVESSSSGRAKGLPRALGAG